MMMSNSESFKHSQVVQRRELTPATFLHSRTKCRDRSKGQRVRKCCGKGRVIRRTSAVRMTTSGQLSPRASDGMSERVNSPRLTCT